MSHACKVLASTVVEPSTHIFADILDRVNVQTLHQIQEMESSDCEDKWSALVQLLVGTELTKKGACMTH